MLHQHINYTSEYMMLEYVIFISHFSNDYAVQSMRVHGVNNSLDNAQAIVIGTETPAWALYIDAFHAQVWYKY